MLVRCNIPSQPSTEQAQLQLWLRTTQSCFQFCGLKLEVYATHFPGVYEANIDRQVAWLESAVQLNVIDKYVRTFTVAKNKV
jgi:hypothetical protein